MTIVENNVARLAHLHLKVLKNHPGDQIYWHRHRSKGAWTLSSADNGWAVSDTTGEALKVLTFFFCFLHLDEKLAISYKIPHNLIWSIY